MGFFSRKKTSHDDDALLVFAMRLIASADGDYSEEEEATVKAFFSQVPELYGKDWDDLAGEAQKLWDRYDTVPECIEAIAQLSTQTLRNKCYLLCVDVALSDSIEVNEDEEAMLDALQEGLGIEDDLAAHIYEVIQLKYVE